MKVGDVERELILELNRCVLNKYPIRTDALKIRKVVNFNSLMGYAELATWSAEVEAENLLLNIFSSDA